MSESSAWSESEDAIDEVVMESSVDVGRKVLKRCLIDFHNCFLCSRDSRRVSCATPSSISSMDPCVGPSIEPSKVPRFRPVADSSFCLVSEPFLVPFGGPSLSLSNQRVRPFVEPSCGPVEGLRILSSFSPSMVPFGEPSLVPI